MNKFLNLTLAVLFFSATVFGQSMTCPVQKTRNNGNNTAACPTGTCGTAGTSKACNVVGTSYDMSACCTYTRKTADIQFSFSNLTNPSAEPALKTVWSGGAALNFNYGPPMTFTSSTDHSTSYCVYGPSGSTALPTAGVITLEFVNPATGITYNMCSYDASATGSVNPIPGPTISSSPTNKYACSGNVVTFSVTATPNSAGDGLSFQWRLNGVAISGATSTSTGTATATYSLTASSGGTYDCVVTETGTGASAGTASISNYATLTIVTAAPTVTASAAPNPICAGNTLTLTGSATNANSYSWAGPGGYTSTVLSPTFTASVSGAGVYTLSATNGCGTNTATTASVTVNASPTSTINATPSVLCSSGTLSLTATITGASSYSWSGPGGFSSTLQNPTLTTTTSSGGVYTVTAAVACGTFVGTTTAVTVNTTPTSVTATASPATLCSGANLTLTGSATGAGTYSWSGPGGTAISSPTSASTGVTGVVSGNAGVYTLTAVSAVGSCSATATTSAVTVNASPTSVTASASPNGVCNGANLTLTGAATGASTYSWAGPGGTAISSPTSQSTGVTGVVSGNAGVYTLTAVSAVGSCSTTATTASVTVNALPSISVGTSTVICTGGSTTLTASGGSTYSWSPATGLSATTGASVSASPTVTTTYTVTGTNSLSCTNTATVTVTVVNTTPTSVTATASSTSLCSGNNLTLTGSATTSAGTLTYAWAGPNSYTATVQNPASFGVSTLSAGVYTITATNVCGSATGVTTAVTVNAVPSVAAISGSSTICTGTSTTYSNTTSGGAWSSSNTAIGTINSSTGELTGISGGSFTVSYAVTNSCGTTTVTQAVSGYFTPTMGVSVGSASTCVGSTTTYTATPSTGYTWSSTNTAVATINSGGSAVGIASGTTTISYVHNIAGCYTTAILTVNSLPTISVTTPVCQGATQTATASPTGGVWASSNTAVGTIGSATGVFAALSAGSTNVSYTLSGCTVQTAVSVTGLPAVITGTTSVCQGSTSQLSSGTASQTWSSSNTAVATITTLNTTTAVVSGVSTGTALISYTNGGGCSRVTTVTVTSPFTANTGDALVCMGQTITLSNTTSGGAWTSSDATKATVNSGTGVVIAVATGTTNITYSTSSPSSCQATTQVTVNAAVPANTGTATVCEGSTTTLSNTTTGGTWSSSNANATVVANTGVVTGVTTGTSIITYLLSSGCYKTTIVTINPVPAAIAGTAVLCEGENTTLTNSTSGGTWISSNTAVGTIGSTSGVVAGLSAGTTLISYRLTTTGCQSTKEVTVNALPSVIGGTSLTCIGITTTLSATPSGGTWSSSDVAVATIGSSNGTLTGVAAGTSNITYTLATGCKRTTVATVNSNPAAIAGTFVLCEGASTTLTNSTTGGTWISSNTAIATVGSATGAVAAVSGGTTTITYRVSATGCYSAQIFTTNPLPANITGTLSVCEGSTTALSTTSTGGTWSSSNAAVAAIGTNGVVSGVAAGTANISYSLSSGCVRAVTVTVNSLPAAIGGTLLICASDNTTLTNTTSGGVWSSSNTAVATIGTSTGIVTGVTNGTATITYTASGCHSTATLTVNQTPAAITGTAATCIGTGTTLSNSVSGGTWSSSNTSVATIGSATGVVTSAAVGTSNISYIMGGGCYVTKTYTVNALPTVTGTLNMCMATSSTLSSSPTGGTWQSSNVAIATVGSLTGIVSGVSSGNSTISYTDLNGCRRTVQVTVNSALATDITGPTGVCVGYSITLSNATPGGTWTSSDPAKATIDASTGVVAGISNGSVIITYAVGAGCNKTMTLAIHNLPQPITGTTTVCEQNVTVLSTITGSSGTWSSSNPSVASVTSTIGNVTGVTSGTATITYTAALTGCYVVRDVTVIPTPAAITGSSSVCVSSQISLSSATSGGTWSSNTTSAATVGSASGVVTGVGAGNTIISYVLANGCRAIKPVTVNAIPSAITGNTVLCPAGTSTLTSTTTGGTWSSGNTSVAGIGSAGVLAPVAAGTTTISYTLSTGCMRTTVVTINAAPATSTGPGTVCVGSTAAFSNATTGGTWSSSNTSKATIVFNTGVLTGVAAGTTNITYTVSGPGCYTVSQVTIDATPAAITGTLNACVGSTSTLSHAVSGGTWSSGNTSIATVNAATGVVTAVAAGYATITYQATPSCFVTASFNSKALPPAITGTPYACVGTTTVLSNTVSGGTWSSSNTASAIIHATSGTLTGMAIGTSTITYRSGTGCFRTTEVSVNAAPAAITGVSAACPGSTAVLSCTPTGGTWASGNTAIATAVASSGTVTAVASGTTSITYTQSVTGCRSFRTFTVGVVPAAITGTLTICEGSTSVLANATTGGTWSSSNLAIATVGSTSGVTAGVAAGTATISYNQSGGCAATAVVTVTPAVGAISGDAGLCVGGQTTLSNATTGGTWSSSATTIATVGSATGIVSGAAAGTAVISYRISDYCYSTRTVTVGVTPAAITGPSSICGTSDITLLHTVAGGTWSSSNSAIGTVNATTGIVTGIAAGTITVSYEISNGCFSTKTVSVYNLPLPITGTTTVCEQNVTILSTVTGSSGTWSSSDPSVATVTPTIGNVTGVASGTAIITYTAAFTGCYVVKEVTVIPTPATITGDSTVCVGSQISLSSVSAGGTWSSNTLTAAVVDTTSGVVTGVGAGNTIISYILPNGCRVIKPVTVNILPAAITGNMLLCPSSTSTLTSTTTGGTWASGNTSVATIGSAGAVTPVAPGTTTISYMLSTGCMRTAVVTINAAPATSTGPGTICIGSTAAFSNATTGGTWSSSNTATATIVFNTGVVTSVAAGTTNITYAVSGPGCYTVSQVTIDATPSAITGTLSACIGSTSTLGHPVSGGTWSSGNTSIATVNATTGVVTAVAAGYATITYQATPSCFVTAAFNSKALPPAITGTPYACVGTTTVLSNTVSGGTWSSSNTANAVISSTSGILTGVATGTATITYTLSTGCYSTTEVTVNAAPAAITGVSAVCVGGSAVLSCTPAGGTWTSGNTTTATIDASTGSVTALATGTTSITYTQDITGCRSFSTLTVGVGPAAITGTLTICEGSTTTLADSTAGGTWSSSDLAIATVGSTSGVTTGVAAGTATISYNHSGGCVATAVVTVTPAVGAISGNASLCVGGQTTLANATSGGSWSSSATAIAGVGSATGIVSGAAAGTAVISYRISDYCYSTQIVTVGATPAAITGASSVCIGSDITLSHAVAGGTWSSSNSAIGSVDATTGVVTGIAAGAITVSYEVSNGCFTTKSININNLPPAISGAMTICESGTSSLTGVSGASATWSSSNTSVATIGSTSGLLTGVAAGTAIITYRLNATGCYSTSEVTINAAPAVITGSNTICVGSTQTYASTTAGGTWSSSNSTIAPIDSVTGVVAGNAGGSVSISYTISNGCRRVKPVTINVLPAAISGTTKYCVGGTATLTSTTGGGTWSSDGVAATVTSGGVVTGTTPGTSLISYTLTTGCARTAVVTVNAALAANTGSNSICVGSTTTLANGTSGGTWSSSDATKATVNATSGLVTGVATGTSNITYSVAGAGCRSTTQVTVNGAVPSISGTLNVCVGAQTTLSNTATGGTWSSSNTAKATIDSATGVVTGVAAGTINITFSLSSGCYKTAAFTVKALPVISGASAVCAGSSALLTASPAGGAWSSSDVSKLTIGSTSGMVSGVSAGTSTVSYLAAGCYASRTVTVNQLPDPISGSAVLCVGTTTTLAGTPSGGAWVSSTVARATVGSSSGVVTGIAAGTSLISYTLPTGCRRTTVVTVGATPNAISGTTNVCLGSTTTLSSTTAGGTWSSANTSVATTGTATAASTLVTGISVGTTTISYTAFGCSRVTTVNVIDPIAPMTGDSAMCVGSAAPLATATTGGTWTSSNVSIARVGSLSGITSAVAVGSVTITYRTGATCFKTKQITVGSGLATITGSTNACVGYTTPLSHPISGGVWSSGNTARATVDASTGVVTGVSNGSVVITYALSTGCYATKSVVVYNLPLPITGTATVCEENVTIFSTVTGSSGTWSTSNTSVATVAPTIGNVTGVASGTATITYTAYSGCYVVKDVTVIPTPAAITGTSTICVGSQITLASATAGGTWSSNTPTAAVVGFTSGVVTAVGGGNAIISYVMPNGCRRTTTVTTNIQPAAITGPATVCVDNSSTLSSATLGQTWSSSNTSVATVGSVSTSTASVTPVAAGTATISYTNAFGCSRTYSITVNGAVPTIAGSASVCTGKTVTLSNTLTGGTWSSSSTAKASVGSASGVVTGVASGSAVITYRVSPACFKTTVMSVNVSPAGITGLSSVLAGASTTLACTTTGGAWSSSNTAIGTVNSTSGSVTGISAGSMTISYVIPASGCVSVKAMTVNPAPLAKDVVETEVVAEVAEFAVFPNPSQGAFNIQTSVSGVLSVFTVDGKLITEYITVAGQNTITLPATLASGTYMGRFTATDGGVKVFRLMYQP